MLIHRKLLSSLLFLVPLLFTAGASAKNSTNTTTKLKNKIPWRIEGKARTFMKNLDNAGFEVSRGYFKLWDKEDCEYTYARIGLCGNNPAAPYVIATVPPWNDEFVDPAFASTWKPSKLGFNDIYRFDPHEAIVIMGQLPPPGSFFSEQTWIFSRQGTYDPNNPRYQAIANSRLHDFTNIFFKQLSDNRALTFASLSNPNNNFVVERQSGASFGQMRYFIITPDKHMDQAVRKMLTTNFGVQPQEIFTEAIPSDMNVGLSEGSDDFTTFIRYAHPNDGGQPGTPSYNWRTNPPLAVFRIREKSPQQNPEKYPPLVYEQRTAVDEHPLKSDQSSLMAAVSRRWGQPCASADCSDRAESFIDLQRDPIWMVGSLCLSYMQNCVGDNWDASYHIHPPSPIDNDEIYAIVGTLGTKTGNATYVSLSMNQIPMIKGVLDISDKELEGSAKEYSAEVSNTEKFYLYFVARNCSGLEHLTNGRCLELSMIPQGYRVAFVQRDYARPGTQRGPDSALILPPMSIKLHRP